MATRTRIYIILGLLAVLAVIGTGVVVASGTKSSDGVSSGGASSGGAAGQIDDGAELLDQAPISLEDALAAAQAAASGKLGEVDLEMYQGRLVFNVDVGNLDIKVDAADGTVLGQEADGSDDDPDSADDDSDSVDDDSDSADGNSGS